MKPLKRLVKIFLSGLLVLLPVGLTFYLVYFLLRRLYDLSLLLEEKLGGHLPYEAPAWLLVLGAAVVVIFITGLLVNSYIGRAVLRRIEGLLTRTPLIKWLYTSIRDLVDAFVGDKKKFTQPVLVALAPGGAKAIGFITQTDLGQIGLPGQIAVYCPYSYGFSGQLLVVPADAVELIEAGGGEVMKFVVSGGITAVEEKG